jgi:hypothetical protein
MINKYIKVIKIKNINCYLFDRISWGLGIGDLGIGDWGLGPIPNPQSPIPNPQSPCIHIYNYFSCLIKLLIP